MQAAFDQRTVDQDPHALASAPTTDASPHPRVFHNRIEEYRTINGCGYPVEGTALRRVNANILRLNMHRSSAKPKMYRVKSNRRRVIATLLAKKQMYIAKKSICVAETGTLLAC